MSAIDIDAADRELNFVFLVYVSRSGSTLLARQLAFHSQEVIALPETRLLELLVAQGEDAVHRLSSARFLDLVKTDRQWQNLGLDDDQWLAVAKEREKGIRALLERVTLMYAERESRNPRFAVIKLGSLVHICETLLPIFPEAKYVHIFRDARAVVNSTVHADSPNYPGLKMGRGDIVFVTRRWVKYLRLVSSLKKRQIVPVHELRYEDLCRSQTQTIQRVFRFIGASYDFSPNDAKGFEFRLAEPERQIHGLVNEEPVEARIDAWKDELNDWQLIAVQEIAGDLLTTVGYESWHPVPRGFLTRMRALAHAYSLHFRQSLLHYLRKAGFYLLRGRLLVQRLRIARIRRSNSC